MKTFNLTISIFIVLTIAWKGSFCQSISKFDSIKVKIDSITQVENARTDFISYHRNGIVDSTKGILVSNRSLNKYLAKETSKYLSGGNDFSFYKTYAAFNNTDKRLSFHYNKAFFQKDSLLSHSFGVGFKGNLVNGISTIYSKGEFDNDFGIILNFTKYLKKGDIYFDKTSKGILKARRLNNADKIYKNALEKISKYKAQNFDLSLLPKELEDIFITKLTADAVNNLYEMELKEAKDLINKKSNCWFGMNLYFPVGKTNYDFTDSLSYLIKPKAPIIDAKKFKAWEIKGNFATLCVSKNKIAVLSRTEITIANYNNVFVLENFGPQKMLLDKFINTNKIQTYAYIDTSKTDRRIRKQTITTDGKKSDLYVGKYQAFTKITLNPSILIGFQKETVLKGIRFFGEIDLQKEWRNVSFSFALPFSFEGKDDKKVNFEIVTTFKDLTNSFTTYPSFFDRLNVGINLGLPLSEFFFK